MFQALNFDVTRETDQLHGLVERLQHYEKILSDFIQAKTLQGLGKGVDVARFAQDSEYKRETILGLTM